MAMGFTTSLNIFFRSFIHSSLLPSEPDFFFGRMFNPSETIDLLSLFL
jgi:membrane protein YqaA with SNARE-associated domain